MARGDILLFSDAHMSFRPGTVGLVYDAVQESGGIVHVPVQWMGGYDPAPPSFSYSLKLGEKFWGTWNHALVSPELHAIPASGHCFFGVDREQFLRHGGYNAHFRCYGGGELYLALKWWTLGHGVFLEPQGLVYHLSAGRGYSYHQNDLIHNMMLLGYALGAPGIAERVYLSYVSRGTPSSAILSSLHEDAKREGERDASTWRDASLLSLLAILSARPWDVWNERVHGESQSFVTVFHETWVESLSPTARALYDASDEQKMLTEYIETHLVDCIHRRQRAHN